jgi:hypothetical protein
VARSLMLFVLVGITSLMPFALAVVTSLMLSVIRRPLVRPPGLAVRSHTHCTGIGSASSDEPAGQGGSNYTQPNTFCISADHKPNASIIAVSTSLMPVGLGCRYATVSSCTGSGGAQSHPLHRYW